MLDAGDYYFAIGTDAHDAAMNVLAAQGQQTAGDAAKVPDLEPGRERFHHLCPQQERHRRGEPAGGHGPELLDARHRHLPDRSDWEGTWPKTYENLTATDEMLDVMDNDNYQITANGVSLLRHLRRRQRPEPG